MFLGVFLISWLNNACLSNKQQFLIEKKSLKNTFLRYIYWDYVLRYYSYEFFYFIEKNKSEVVLFGSPSLKFYFYI